MELSLGCKLHYTLEQPTGFVLQIEAAKSEGQIVSDEALVIPGGNANATYSVFIDPITQNRVVRPIVGPGPVEIYYEAKVALTGEGVAPSAVSEFDFIELPMEYLQYLAPSRYCASDTFTKFAFDTFGGMRRGHDRVTAVSEWVHDNIVYQQGSTGPSTSSAEVFQKKAGVCRDFAHLGISLCRALGIPARYISASDVAFAWPQGAVVYQPPEVWVNAPSRSAAIRTTAAVGRP